MIDSDRLMRTQPENHKFQFEFNPSDFSTARNLEASRNSANSKESKFSPVEIAASGASGVDQGKYGDCVFEASLAALASTKYGQQKISDMIDKDTDGSFTVSFPGDKEHKATVTVEDLSNFKTRDSAIWANVLETALVKDYPKFANGANVPEHAAGGSHGEAPTPAQYAMYLLTGKNADKSDADNDGNENVPKKIESSLHNDRPVVAFCKDSDKGALVSGHEWTVMSYEPLAREITVRNPWGNFKGREADGIIDLSDGKVKMPYSTFRQFFREVTFGA